MVTIKDFAKLLNVELGEEFLLADEDGTYEPRYRFTENGVEYLSLDGWKKYGLDINFIIDKKIMKIPWKPRIGEVYFYIDETYTVAWAKWMDDFCDFARYAIGNLFPSTEEANENKEILLENLKDMYYKENPLIKARL